MATGNKRAFRLLDQPIASLPSTEFDHSHAVVIGINAYHNGIPPLRTARPDAERLAQILRETHGYTTELLVDDLSVTQLTHLLQVELPQRVGKADRLLVYFAGHGIALPGDDGPAGYLILQDADATDPNTFLPMQTLHDALARLACRHCLVILDCCFAGAFRWSSRRALAAPPGILYRERYERFLRSPAWQVLTSAAYDQEALDTLLGNGFGTRDGVTATDGDHSPFALALFAALTGAGDANRDGVVIATELYLYLRDQVELRAAQSVKHYQTPGLWPLQKHDKGEFLFLLGVPDLPPAPPLTTANNPYRGLQSYDEAHAALFFGRQTLIEKLALLVTAQRLTVVLGASGTGKSSLVKAGLLPYLRHAAGEQSAEQLADTAHSANSWRILPVVRLTESPLRVFTEIIEQLQNDRAASAHGPQRDLLVIDQFEELITLCHQESERIAFLDLLAELLEIQGDQLHIVLTLRTDFEPQFADLALATHWRAGRFVVPPLTQSELREIIEGPAGVRVLFFDPPALVDQLIDEVIQTPGALPLLSFTLEQLYLKYLQRQAVAKQNGETIERALTQADYAALGGVIGSLRTRADEEYAQLPDQAHRETMARVMLRMVALEGGDLARRRVLLTELLYPSAPENARVTTVLNQLVAARLLVSDSADADRDGVADAHVEPAHDALVRAWDRLLAWQQGFAEYLPLQRSLTAAANEWAQAGRDPQSGLLWNNNPRLPQLQEILTSRHPNHSPTHTGIRRASQALWPSTNVTTAPTWLNALETQFVQRSVARRATVLKRIVALTLAVIVALSALTIFAFDRQRQATNSANSLAAEVIVRSTAQAVAVTRAAEALAAGATAVAETNARATQEAIAVTQRDLARSRELAVVAQGQLDADPEQALLIALAANTITRTFESEGALRAALQASPVRGRFALVEGKVQATAFSPRGDQLLVTGMAANAPFAQLLDFPALTSRLTLPTTDGYYPLTTGFSPQGTYAWAIYNETTLQIWDAQRGTEVLTVPAAAVAWFRDESTIVTASTTDGTFVQRWDLRQGKVVATLGEQGADRAYPRLLGVTPDQQQVILVTWPDFDFAVTAWNLQSGVQVTHFTVDPSIAFSPAGGLLAYGQQAAVVLRDTLRQTVIMSMTNHTADVYQTTFSPDGHHLASAAADNSVYVWQIVDAPPNTALIPAFAVPTTGSVQLAFAPDRPLLLTWDERNGLINGWSTQTKSQLVATLATGQAIRQLHFAPQGSTFVTVDEDGALRLWSANFGEEWGSVPPLPQFSTTGTRAAHLAPDNKSLAVTVDHTLKFFDVATRKWQTNTLTMTQNIRDFAFTADGAHLVAYGEREIVWWALPGGHPLGTLTTVSETVSTVALAADGQRGAAVLTGAQPNPDADNERVESVALFDLTTGQWHPLAAAPRYRSVQNISFAPHDPTLLVIGSTTVNEGGSNHLVRVWDTLTGQLRFAQDFGPETNAQYLPDGQRLLIVRRNEISLWDLQSGAQLAAVVPASPLSTLTLSITTDGKRLVLPDGFSSTAQVWDLVTLRPLFSLIGHEPSSTITTVQFSQDGRLILTASSGDNTIRLWDGAQGTLLSVLPYARESELSTDGRFIMAKDGFAAPKLYLTRFSELMALAKSRTTRTLTCEERRDFLHIAIVCPVATPMPVAS